MNQRHLSHPARLLCACFGGAAGTGLDLSGFDPTVRFQDDLFRAVNGGWLARTEIPPDKPACGAFSRLRDLSDERVRAIAEDCAAQAPPADATSQRVGAFYAAFMNTDAIDAAGLAPIRPLLDEIDAIETALAFARWQGRMQGRLDTPVSLWVAADFREPGMNRPMTWQGGLGLPDRDYFLKRDDARMAAARDAYSTYLTTLAALSGADRPEQVAARVLALEHRIAELHWDNVRNRDPLGLYNPMTVDELARHAPGFEWAAFLEGARLSGVDRITVSQPSVVTGMAGLFAEVPLADWKQYFRMHALDEAATLLPEAFREARFAFRGAALAGMRSDTPRWQQATAALNRALGDAVGQLYVVRHFTPEHAARLQALVDDLLGAYRDSIEGLRWMSDATKAQAQDKLAKYTTKIGSPHTWRDDQGLIANDGDALGNAQRAAGFEWCRVAAKAGQPVDRGEWSMTPQTVNACYDPSRNEIVFPAAILQPPFFDIGADAALNYGAIGAVIGHEISHGFDDQGSRFDGDGLLRDWWTEADRGAFEAIGAQLVAQYERYEPIAGCRLNGRLTLGENIADLAGLQIAYKAYQRSAARADSATVDGHSGAQRFFLGWSQIWREKVREERSLQLLSIDPHAPPEFRANGVAVNHDGFHAAFSTAPGDAMFKPPAERIRVW